MAVSTVTQPRRRVTDGSVKSRSGFWQTLRGKNSADTGEFEPDEQSTWVLQQVKGELSKAVNYVVAKQRENHTVASPTDLDGSHPAYLLRHLAMLALDLEIDPKATFESSVNRMQWAWDMLNERAAEQAALERHTPVNAAEAAADGVLMAAAARRGKESGRGAVVAAEIVDRAAKAPFPTELQAALTPDVLAQMDAERAAQVERTAVLPVIETVTVGHAATAVHIPGDGSHAPVPAEDDEVADPGSAKPLPKRVPQSIPYGESSQVVTQAAESGEAS